ncbi:phosphoribosylglycinamide synthetase C domain-containing protein [Candidatus Aenigmatarchaeota archaeon]
MKKTNFLFITEWNNDFLILKLKQEGHNIKIHPTKYGRAFKGILNKNDYVKDWKSFVDWADIIIFDSVGHGAEADRLRKQGKKVIGGSRYTDKLELDREFGQKELQKTGIKILKETEFDSKSKVIRFIRKNPKRYVFKPCGTSDMDTTFIGEAKDGKDLIELIKSDKRLNKIKKFFLQEYVQGIEVAVGAFFNGNDFVEPINVNFEHKRLFTGDLGPLTWEMGTLICFTKQKKLFNKTLLKLKNKIKESGYVGYLDINCIVNKDGIHPLEFTSRFGYPHAAIMWEGSKDNAAETIIKFVSGKKCYWAPEKGFNIGIVITTPPFPYHDKIELKKYADLPIEFKDKKLAGIYFSDVIKKDDKFLTDGFTPLIVAAHAQTFEKARKVVYERVKKISIENMYYRTDIGSKWIVASKKLRKLGYV